MSLVLLGWFEEYSIVSYIQAFSLGGSQLHGFLMKKLLELALKVAVLYPQLDKIDYIFGCKNKFMFLTTKCM